MTEAGVAVKSPLTGSVKEVFVKEGDYVNAGQPLASVTQNTRLYLQADLSENIGKKRLPSPEPTSDHHIQMKPII